MQNLAALKAQIEEFRLMKAKVEKYKSAADFGRSLGLTDVEIEIICYKKRLIEKLRKIHCKSLWVSLQRHQGQWQ